MSASRGGWSVESCRRASPRSPCSRALLPVALSCALLAVDQGAAWQSTPIVLRGARLLDPEGGSYAPAAVVVLDGARVAAVHARPPADLPAGAEVIDLEGATLVPGLGDMTVRPAPTSVFDADYFHLQALAAGVTGMRTVDVPLPWAAAQRQRADAGDLVAPRIWTSGPGIEERGLDRWRGSSQNAVGVRDAQSAVQAVQAQARAGAQWVVLGGTVGPALVRAAVAAAESQGVKVSGEALSTPMTVMAESGVQAIEGPGAPARPIDATAAIVRPPDVDGESLRDAAWAAARPEEIRAAVTALVRSGTALVTRLDRSWARTQSTEALLERAELAALPEEARTAILAAAVRDEAALQQASRAWTRQLAFVRDLVAAGGVVVPGSGAGLDPLVMPGSGLHRELAHLVDAGMTPAEAIRAATAGWRATVQATDQPVIRAGALADFFAVTGDPLERIEDLSKVTLIVRRGEIHRPDELRARAARAVRVRTR